MLAGITPVGVMSNSLPLEKKTAIVSALVEGSSIRSIERMTNVHRDTIMRLGVRMGEGCKRIMNEKMRNLDCRLIQVDCFTSTAEKGLKSAE